MCHWETHEPLDLPWENQVGEVEGLDVEFRASNVEPELIPELLSTFYAAVFEEAGEHVSPHYWSESPHEASSIHAYERYVRIRREWAENLTPDEGAEPAQVALDETVIWIECQQYWLYAAVNLATNRFLHVRLYSTRTTALTEMFLAELVKKHDVEDALFLIDSAAWLKAALHCRSLEFQYERHGDRNSIERVHREVKRRTSSFSNSFSHVDPATADSWLQAFARWHNETN